MREGLKRAVVPIGSHEWLDRQRMGQEPDWHNGLPEVTNKLDTPQTMQQFWREIGRCGGLERCRSFARRSPRCWRRFHQLYRCDPNRVKAAAVRASPEVRRHLRALASRGGRARARKYNPEQLKAWAAKGGRVKAAKRRQASSRAQSVAGKQQ